MNKGLLILAVLMFSASAYSFPASIHAIDTQASPEDPAIFQVNVQNNISNSGSFSISTFSPKPSWFYNDGSKTLEPGENGSFRITIKPDKYAVAQSYGFTVYAKSSIAKTQNLKSSFHVKRSKQLVLEDFTVNRSEYMPGARLKGNVKIRSLSSQTIKNYKIKISAENSSTTLRSSPILPGGTRKLSYTLPLDKNAKPVKSKLKASIIKDGAEIEHAEKNYSIKTVRKIKTNKSYKNTIFTIEGSKTARNLGNVPINYTVNISFPSYLSPITGFSEEPTSTSSNNSHTVYRWQKNLKPGEEFTVKRYTNYWMPMIGLIGIIIALAGIQRLRKSVTIEKTVEKTDQGLKVSIEVENLSDRTFRDVTVHDFIPDIAEVNRDFEMARPRVRKTNEGTKLTWDLDSMEPGDQRVLQYTIKPKVEVEGGVKLQKASIKEGDEKIKESNALETEFSP